MTTRPDEWTTEDLLELIDPVRSQAAAVLAKHEIAGERAREILAAAYLAATRPDCTTPERRKLFMDAVEQACREARAALGPPAEREEEPYVH